MTGSEPEFEDEDERDVDDAPASDSEPNTAELSDENTAREPPEPESEASIDARWGVGSRVVLLSALIGCAIFMWVQFAFKSRWVPEFLLSNTLPDSAQRGTLVLAFVSGLCVGAAFGAFALYSASKKRIGWEICGRRGKHGYLLVRMAARRAPHSPDTTHQTIFGLASSRRL